MNDITGGLEIVPAVKYIAAMVKQLMVSCVNKSAKNNDSFIVPVIQDYGDFRGIS